MFKMLHILICIGRLCTKVLTVCFVAVLFFVYYAYQSNEALNADCIQVLFTLILDIVNIGCNHKGLQRRFYMSHHLIRI